MTGSSRTEVQRSSYSWVNEAHLLVSMIHQFEYCDNKETKSHLADNRQKVYMTGDQNIPHAIQLKIHAVLLLCGHMNAVDSAYSGGKV